MTKLIIVRHCQAQGNLERFFQGNIDTDITPKGREQIDKTARMLSAEPIDIFYTSYKKRAIKTMEGINLYHNVPVVNDERLTEINAGKWEGMSLTDIEKQYPAEFDDWNNHPERFHAPGGESMSQVYDRVSSALRDIIRDNDGKTVCIVSHGCAIKCIMCYLHGWKVNNIGEVKLGTNMSVNVVEADQSMNTRIIMENHTDHLA